MNLGTYLFLGVLFLIIVPKETVRSIGFLDSVLTILLWPLWSLVLIVGWFRGLK